MYVHVCVLFISTYGTVQSNLALTRVHRTTVLHVSRETHKLFA